MSTKGVFWLQLCNQMQELEGFRLVSGFNTRLEFEEMLFMPTNLC